MRKIDRAILRFLLNEGNRELVATPGVIAANTGFKSDYLRQRVGPLREVGLIEYADEESGLYQIADRGRRYLSGEMSEEEAAELDEELAELS